MKFQQSQIAPWAAIWPCVLTFMLTLSPCAMATDVKATWKPVEKDVSGAKDSISHYLLYLGRTPRPAHVSHPGDGTFAYEKVLNAGRNTQHVATGLAPGTWFFSVCAVDTDGNISDYSRQIKIEIPDKDGKVPPPVIKKSKANRRVKIKKPSEGGCSTARTEPQVTLLSGLLLLLMGWPGKRN